MITRTLKVANAPISYGAFELTVGVNGAVPEAEQLLDLVVDAGYDGVDLGPVGFLGRNDDLRKQLADRHLGLAGGYLELPFSDPGALDRHMALLDELLDTFDEAATRVGPKPKPTLADAGAPHRRHNVGRSAHDRSLGLDDPAWTRFSHGVGIVVEHCRRRGYEPTLHPESGTYIEAEWEIDRALEICDIGLCLETGHQVVGGGDPLSTLQRWGSRINHIHVKDVNIDVVNNIVAESLPVENLWTDRAFCPLGSGDVAVVEILAAISAIDYDGWIVVEQDIMPGPSDPDEAHNAQRSNRDLLRAHGF